MADNTYGDPVVFDATPVVFPVEFPVVLAKLAVFPPPELVLFEPGFDVLPLAGGDVVPVLFEV